MKQSGFDVVRMFFREGVLTESEAIAATAYIGSLEETPDWMSHNYVLAGQPATYKFGRLECFKFCDWSILSGKVNNPTVTMFLMRVLYQASHGVARRLNQNTPPEFRRKGLNYFRDIVSSFAANVLFGGAHIRILRLESIKKAKPVEITYTRRERSPVTGKVTVREETKERKSFFVNKHYRVLGSQLFTDFLDVEAGEFFVVSQSRQDNRYWTVGRKMRTGSSPTSIALAIARANFVAMDIGRISVTGKVLDKVTFDELSDRRCSVSDYEKLSGQELFDLSMRFVDESPNLSNNERMILRASLTCPMEVSVYRHFTRTHNKHRRMRKKEFYKLLRSSQRALNEWFTNGFEH